MVGVAVEEGRAREGGILTGQLRRLPCWTITGAANRGREGGHRTETNQKGRFAPELAIGFMSKSDQSSPRLSLRK